MEVVSTTPRLVDEVRTERAIYVVAALITLVAFVLPPPDGGEDSLLTTLVVALIVLAMVAVPRVALAVVVLAFPLTELRVWLGSLNFPLADLAALALAAAVVLGTARTAPVPTLLRWYVPLIAVAVASGLVADDPGAATYYGIRFYAFYGIVFMGAVLPVAAAHVSFCLRGLRITFVVLTATALGLAYYRIVVQDDLWSHGQLRAGPFGDAQEAVVTILATILPLIRRMRRAAGANRPSSTETAAIVGILLSFTKTAWLTLLAGLLLEAAIEKSYVGGFAAIRRRLRELALWLPIALALVAFVLTAVFVGSIMERSAMWIGATEYWLRSPLLGFGPGTVGDLLLQSAWIRAFLDDATIFPTDAHGFLIKLLPEVGLLGTIAFCAFLTRMLALAVVALKTRVYADYRFNAAALSMLVCSILMISVGTDTLSPRFWFVAALGVAVLRLPPKAD